MEKIAEEQKSERVNANNSVLFHMILFKRGIPKQVQSESRLIEIAYALLRINRRCFWLKDKVNYVGFCGSARKKFKLLVPHI